MPLKEAAPVVGTKQNLSNILFLDIYGLSYITTAVAIVVHFQ
jgi:hypothetical protein